MLVESFLLVASAWAAPTTVVTFDNGEFNAPLYSPRWNGRWRKPSLAQELATSVARVTGANPRVFTYMPPGRTEGRPGELHPVPAVRPGCDGPAATPDDRCWCSPADNCWGALQANYHPSGSTSLVRTAAAVRAALRAEGADGPRFEVHFTDFFEEDPGSAEDPADSDRCVTADGVRRAVAGLVAMADGESLDHLAFGLLKVSVDPPPPGGGWGFTYSLVSAGDGCWSGEKGRPWTHRSAPLELVMGIVVAGVDTGEAPEQGAQFIDGLEQQLRGDGEQLGLVRLVEPRPPRVIEEAVTALDAEPWRLPALRDAPRVPCGTVHAQGELRTAHGILQLHDVQGRCDGQVGVSFGPGELRRHFLHTAGLHPGVTFLPLQGRVEVRSRPEAVSEALASLAELNEAERSLPLFQAASDALDPTVSPAGVVQPWGTVVEVRQLVVTELDHRPWLIATLLSTLMGLIGGWSTATGLRQVHAARAMRAGYEEAGRNDPLEQRPLSSVIAEAQQKVDQGWVVRALTGSIVGIALIVTCFWAVLTLYKVALG